MAYSFSITKGKEKGWKKTLMENTGDNEFQQFRGAGEGIYWYEDGAENTCWWTRDILHRMPGGWDDLDLIFPMEGWRKSSWRSAGFHQSFHPRLALAVCARTWTGTLYKNYITASRDVAWKQFLMCNVHNIKYVTILVNIY